MVLGLLLIAGLPTAIGVTTGVAKADGNQGDEEREAEMAKESQLSVFCDLKTARGKKSTASLCFCQKARSLLE